VPADINAVSMREGSAARAVGAAWLALMILGASAFVPGENMLARAQEPASGQAAKPDFYDEIKPSAEQEKVREHRIKAKQRQAQQAEAAAKAKQAASPSAPSENPVVRVRAGSQSCGLPRWSRRPRKRPRPTQTTQTTQQQPGAVTQTTPPPAQAGAAGFGSGARHAHAARVLGAPNAPPTPTPPVSSVRAERIHAAERARAGCQHAVERGPAPPPRRP
jgi:hypothetical protein